MFLFMRSLNINPEILAALVDNAWVFWKDNSGNYLGCNHRMALDLNLESVNEIVGCSDFDLPFLKEEAEYYRASDKQVLKACLPFQFNDTATLRHIKYQFQVIKFPLLMAQSLIGVIGISYFDSQKKDIISKTRTLYTQSKLSVELTLKEQQIVNLLIRGKTAKEIAIHTKLSPRTIEHHLERIKIKFNVRTKSQLIELLLIALQA